MRQVEQRHKESVLTRALISTLSIAVIFFFASAGYGSISRVGWQGAQSFLRVTTWIISIYLVLILLYGLFRKWIKTSKLILFLAGVLITSFLLPGAITRDSSTLVALSIFLSMLGYGSALDALISRKIRLGWQSWPIFGNVVVVTLLHVFDSLHILRLGYVIGLVAVGLLLLMLNVSRGRLGHDRRSFLQVQGRFKTLHGDLGILFTVPLGLLAIASNAPDVLFDSLAFKAWMPRQWFLHNHLFLLVDHVQSGTNGSSAYLLLEANYLGASNIGAKLQFLSLCYILAIIIYRGVKSEKLVLAAVLSFVIMTIPANLWQVSGAYDDLWLALLCLSAIACVIELKEKNQKLSINFPATIGIVSASLFLGKVSLFPFMIGVFLTPLILPQAENWILKLTLTLKSAFFLLLGILLPVAWRWIGYGNPVWPLYNGIFHAPSLPFLNDHFNLPMGPLTVRYLLTAPIESFFHPEKWVEGGSIGLYSFTLLSAYLGVTFLFRRSFHFEKVFIGGVAALFLINWWVSFRYLRYTLPIAPIVAYGLVLPQQRNLRFLTDKRLIKLLLIFSIPAIAAIPTGDPASPDRIPFKTIFGAENPHDYLLRSMPAVEVIDWLNANASRNANIAGPAGILYQRMLLRGDLDIFYDWELTADSNSKIQYVLIYRGASTPSLENLVKGKCLLKSFHQDLDLYGACK